MSRAVGALLFARSVTRRTPSSACSNWAVSRHSSRLLLSVTTVSYLQPNANTACITAGRKGRPLPARRSLSSSSSSSSESTDDFLDNLGQLLDHREQDEQDKFAKEEAETYAADENDGWRRVDWQRQFQDWLASSPEIAPATASPVEPVLVRNRVVHFKRDDQLQLQGAPVSGNKARKFLALHQLLAEDFPECVVSYGGPQSNAMVALAAIVHFHNQQAAAALEQQVNSGGNDNKNEATSDRGSDKEDYDQATFSDSTADPSPQKLKRFVYYTKTLPKFLRDKPNGNLFRAQALGMELIELSPQEYGTLFGGEWGGPPQPPPAILPPVPGDFLWVPQGGACGIALQGAWELAYEIATYWSHKGKGRPLTVCIPGGTCTTAALVSWALHDILTTHAAQSDTDSCIDPNMDIRVVVIPCVGDQQYAHRQMAALCKELTTATQGANNNDIMERIPTVLPPAPENARYFGQGSTTTTAQQNGYFRFGEPNAEILDTFREMKEQYGVVLDLVYGAPSWTILLRHFRTYSNAAPQQNEDNDAAAMFDPKAPLVGREIMHVHSGGLEGIVTQLNRYLYKGLVDIEEVQLPRRR